MTEQLANVKNRSIDKGLVYPVSMSRVEIWEMLLLRKNMMCPNCNKHHAEHTQGDVNICFRKLLDVSE